MRILSIFFLAIIISVPAYAEGSEADQIMDDIENRIKMPKGALPIRSYTRTYYKRKNLIKATYLKSEVAEKRGRFWSPVEVKSIQGGGCYQVNVTYNPKTKKIDAHCNGPK